MTITEANRAATNAGLYVLVKGADSESGYATATGQSVEAGKQVAQGTTIRVDFSDQTASD